MAKKSAIDNAMLIAAEVFNGGYLWYVDSCLTFDEAIEVKNETRSAFKTLRQHGLSYKQVKLHVERQANKTEEPLPFIDRVFIPIETDELPF